MRAILGLAGLVGTSVLVFFELGTAAGFVFLWVLLFLWDISESLEEIRKNL